MLSLGREQVKKVFLFFIVFLPIQYIYIGVVGVLWSEPWPAFALPGFKTVYTNQEQIEVTKPLFYAQLQNGKEIEVGSAELFSGIQQSQLQGFIRTNFSEEKSFSDGVKDWLRKELKRMHPEKIPENLSIRWTQILYEKTDASVSEISRETTRVIKISLPE